MELFVTTELDQLELNGAIDKETRAILEDIIEDVRSDAYEDGLMVDNGDYEAGVDSGYDQGWDSGYEQAKSDLRDELRDEWFEQGWAAALAEHGIEE